MAKIFINDQELVLADDERLNAIEAAARLGEDVPHYCWHPGMSVVASCRMCLVETGRKNPETGETQMVPKLVPGCQTPATDGTVIVTNSDKVKQARSQVEEDLLIDHPIDCPICDKAGECRLQDYHFEHGQNERRADIRPFTSRRRPLGDTVTLFVDRCIMCTRCVRFTREITGTSELFVNGRGASEEIDVFPGYPLDNKMSGNVVDLCPVGALGDKDFLYQQRVWFMKSHDNVCTGCSTGCSIHIDENQDKVYRLRPRENQQINQWWMCDEGRYGFHHVHDAKRIAGPRTLVDGELANADWSRLPEELNEMLSAACGFASSLAAVLSPHLTVEEAYLLAKYVRDLDPEAQLVLGPVPTEGEDEQFKSGFTIRAEKCPNRRGVEQVIAHFAGEVQTLDDILPEIEQGKFAAVWVSGGYKSSGNDDDWIDETTAERFDGVKLLVVQDLFDSPLMARATYQLPSAAFAEREGSYVNHADRLQSFRWAIRPPMGVRTEASLLWRLLGRSGMVQAKDVLAEVAREILYFSAVEGDVPDVGIDLKLNQLASV